MSVEQLASLKEATQAKLRQLKTGPLTKDAITHQDLTSRGGTKYVSLTVSGVMRRGLSAENWLRLLGEEELNVDFLNALRADALALKAQTVVE
jgi:hypothetical protein